LNYIHLIDRLSNKENIVKIQQHWSSNRQAKGKDNWKNAKNKAINRGVIPLSAEPNEIEWACNVRQRVERWMKWTKWIAFREDEKWKETKTVQREIKERQSDRTKTQFQGIGKTMARPKNAEKLFRTFTPLHSLPPKKSFCPQKLNCSFRNPYNKWVMNNP